MEDVILKTVWNKRKKIDVKKMSDSNNHIKPYTAQDIERYLNRQMPAHEMHALEKAALDDPFLADALEGYMNTAPVSVTGDIAAMIKELDRKTGTRVVGMRFKKIAWSAAAAIIILLGAATTWFWLRPSTQNNIAQQTKEEKSQPAAAPPAQQDNLKVTTDTVPALTPPAQKEPVVISSPGNKKTTPGPLSLEENKNATANLPQKDVPAERQGFAKNKNQAALDDKVSGLQSRKPESLPANQQRTPDPQQGDVATATVQAEDLRAARAYLPLNIFTGTITDNNNKPLPFVNISIANTPASTYTDAKGNFRLTSADTQLVVHLRSVGFEEKEIALTSTRAVHSIQLQPHANALNEVVVTGYGSSKKRSITGNSNVKKSEEEKQDEEPEAEPKDGWAAYDAYMMNNTRPPFSNPGSTLKGSVELSFTVNKYGVLTDFRIEKSGCTLCNNEAIRLIKEGPAWKLLSGEKPARITLTMYF